MKKKKRQRELEMAKYMSYNKGFHDGYKAHERGEHHQWFSTTDLSTTLLVRDDDKQEEVQPS